MNITTNLSKIEILIASGRSVFRIADLGLLWEVKDISKIKDIVKYYLGTKKLISLKRGLYLLDSGRTDNFEELLSIGQKLVPYSYVSLFTALHIHGINYQLYDEIHFISSVSKKYTINKTSYNYHRIKPDILYSHLGIQSKNGYMLASPERAICDTLYLYPDSAFDYLDGINRDRMYDIAKEYNNKTLLKKIEKLCSI